MTTNPEEVTMAALVSTVEIDRPPDVVFAYLTDPARFPEWQSDVRGVSTDGATFTTTRRIGRTDRSMTQRVTECAPPRRWAARAVDGPVRPDASISVEPLDGGTRSRVTFTLDFAGHGIGAPLVPIIRRMAARAAPVSYANAKRLIETAR
jgi:uncharacterized protein YndB with AHSA1/START domain